MEHSGGGAITNPEENTENNNGIGMITWSNVDSSRLKTHSNSDFFVKEGGLRKSIPKGQSFTPVGAEFDYIEYYTANNLIDDGKPSNNSPVNSIYQQLKDYGNVYGKRSINYLNNDETYNNAFYLVSFKNINAYFPIKSSLIEPSISYIGESLNYNTNYDPIRVPKYKIGDDIHTKYDFYTYVSNKPFFISKPPLSNNLAILSDEGINGNILALEYRGTKLPKNENEILSYIENLTDWIYDYIIIIKLDVDYDEIDFNSEKFAELNSITIDYYDKEFKFLRTISSI